VKKLNPATIRDSLCGLRLKDGTMSKARYLKVDRSQLRWDLVDLESQLAMDHRARIVWAFVEELDLRAFHDRIGSREDSAGRPPPDPKILLSLWLYATLEGLGSARALDRACQTDTAYRWLCGGVAMNYHSLSDFRSGNGELLDELLTENVCALMTAGLVSLDEVVQDGTKVRAAAGRGSFVGEDGLLGYEKKARARVHRLREELETDPGASDRRGRAARERAAEEVGERARQARETLERLRQEKAAGFNVQVAADGWFVVGVAATDRRNDTGLAEPMVEQLVERYDKTPRRLVVDGKIATRDEIVALAAHPKGRVEVYAPVPEERENVKPESRRKRAWQRRKEPAAIKAWRARMETEEGAATMRRRKHIETLIAITMNRGMRRMLVRGMEKVRSCVLFQALANNLMQAHRLRAVNQPA
jgi:transposase